ncbi:MAG: GNAT family N-acetyltransferase [Candidatus Buchananbacteria bacterium]
MEGVIKKARIQDLKAVQELNLLLFKKEYQEFDQTLDRQWTFSSAGEKYFKHRLTKDDGCIFLAYVDDKLVGYLAGGLNNHLPCRVLPKLAELENTLVLEEFRSQGIGTKLYQAFVDWCKTKGVKRLRVIASVQNVKGINFYRKSGFVDYDLILETEL